MSLGRSSGGLHALLKFSRLNDHEITFTMAPEATLAFADFLSLIGLIKVKPTAWTDYFFPDIHDLKGS